MPTNDDDLPGLIPQEAATLRRSAERRDEAKKEWKRLAAQAREAKACYELRVIEHERVERDMLYPVEEPYGLASESADPSGRIEPDNHEEDDSWRMVSLQSVLVEQSLWGPLDESDIFTLGQLADYSARGKWLTDIVGIGPAKSERIEQKCAEFWALRRNRFDRPAAEDGDDEEF
jgi:hypothetical protein